MWPQYLSYFCLSYGDIAIVGLDAAYFDSSPLYMDGGFGDPATAPYQYEFLKDVLKDHNQLVLLTHQTGMNTAGTGTLPAWTDLTKNLNRDEIAKIKLWYWGHIHLGIVYGEQSTLGKLGVGARCVGHSAIPIGKAWGLSTGDSIIDWIAETPVGGTAYGNRVRNGFALLTLQNGRITEAFYEEGNTTPVWPPTKIPIPWYRHLCASVCRLLKRN